VLSFGCTPTLGSGARDDLLEVLSLEKVLREPGEVDRFFGGAEPFELVRMDDALDGVEFPRAPNRPDPAGLCYIKISDGCQSQCGFCAIRQAKGLVRSVPIETIARDLRAGLAKGKKRFFLACDDATCWGRDAGQDLSHLLRRLVAEAPDCELVCNTFNPMSLIGIFDKVLPYLRNFSFLSIPMQSGNDRVLKLMKRGYKAGEVLPLLGRIRRANPSIVLNTDIVVGYPTETFAEFQDSVRAAARFDSAYFFVFQPRPGTPGAAVSGLVPIAEMRRRIAVVRRLKSRYRFDDSLAEPERPS
jgi:tRNA A37 methylthiotransferase MiaB